jgi:hypothetical protein
VLRQLLERAHEIDRQTRRLEYQISLSQRELQSIDQRRQQLDRSLHDLEARRMEAESLLAQHDRPLHRRRHRQEVETARSQSQWLPRAIAQAQTELGELATKESAVRKRLERAGLNLQDRQGLVGERHAIGRRLDDDRLARGTDRAAEPPAYVVDRLGPRPATRPAALLWEVAAGQLMQHHTAFELDQGSLLGPQPRPLDDDAYTASHWAATEAAARLDRALGRELEIEPPDRSLGLSL